VTRFAWLLLAVFLLLSAPVGAEEPAAKGGDEGLFLARARQLTFEGRRAGEGYFSPDGRFLVFQSEREQGNPFYQIYELEFESGESRRVSPGAGKTTCAFYQAGSNDILFASTHHDPRSAEYQQAELDARAAGEQKRYAWDYDPEMELFVARRDGKLQRLTEARGYDAEASYSPDGKLIVFASTREAYSRELSEIQQRQLETDPSFFADLYVMRADGSDVKRLTEAKGYDGGPFFSADGQRIVWRRFDEQGLIADLWTMRIDGSDKQQVTAFESMSWAPYPHPSGEYYIFTSNKHGFENFELFIVDTAGRKQPVRVTFTDGFDGLPVFAPDGDKLAWTSTRRSVGEGQLFFAAWNHSHALKALSEAPARVAE